jgi:hypothetical protein
MREEEEEEEKESFLFTRLSAYVFEDTTYAVLSLTPGIDI